MKYRPVHQAVRCALLFLLVLLLLILISNLSDSFRTALVENLRFQAIVTVLFLAPLIGAFWYGGEAVRQSRRQWAVLSFPIRLLAAGLGVLLLIQVILAFRGS